MTIGIEIVLGTNTSISYVVEPNDKFANLPAYDQESILETFSKRRYYTFSLSTHSNRYNEQNILPRMLEFKHVYLSLASYITAQLESHLPADASLNIQGIDYCPYLNYAEKYFSRLFGLDSNYESLLHSDYKTDVRQYQQLQELSIKSKGIYRKQRKLFKVTDHKPVALRLLGLNTVRWILLSYAVPIKVTGTKTVDEVHIHVPAYIRALQKEFKRTFDEDFYNSDYKQQKLDRLRHLIEHMYHHHLTDEKTKIIEQQRAEFIKTFYIQKNDILELKDGRLVAAESIALNEDDNVEIKYSILKNNLQESVRKRVINLEQVSFYLKAADFEEHLEHVPVKRLSLLKRWMEKRKHKSSVYTFESDLTREI